VQLTQVVWNFPSSVREPLGMYYFYWPVREAVARGHQAEVLTFQNHPGQPAEEVMDGIRVRRFPLLGGRRVSPAFIRALVRSEADIIHTHGYGELQSEVAIILGQRGRPVVFTPHFHLYPWSRRARDLYDRTAGLFFLRRAARVVVFTPFTRAHLVRLGVPPQRVAVVPHVARPELFAADGRDGGGPEDAAARARLRALGVHGTPLILGVGQLIRRKGWEYTVRCLPEILRVHAEATFVLLGLRQRTEPQFTEWLYALAAQLGVREHVVILPDNPPERILDAYRAATLLTHPSLVESFGIVLLEAMCARLPVVAHAGTGIPDIICDGTNGYTVDVRATPAYTARLLQLLDDQALRRRLGEGGYALARTAYSLSSVAPRLFAVYDDLLAGRK
jgi:glycosyltransferase involved in cell wall biosynthesis